MEYCDTSNCVKCNNNIPDAIQYILPDLYLWYGEINQEWSLQGNTVEQCSWNSIPIYELYETPIMQYSCILAKITIYTYKNNKIY